MITLENIIIYILTALVLALIVWIILTEIRLKKFFRSKNGGDLEGVLKNLEKDLLLLEGARANMSNHLMDIEKRLKRSVQGVGLVRFNAFPDSGGSQSFAIALINESGDGVILSSLYSREKVSIFSKPLKEHRSLFELTEEEKKALEIAKEYAK